MCCITPGVGNRLVNACRFNVPRHSVCQPHPFFIQVKVNNTSFESKQNRYVKHGTSACH